MRCPKCGVENPDAKRFCGDCGAALSTAPAPPNELPPLAAAQSAPAAQLPEGERKTVTALFADIKGSTELMRDLDPEEARAIIDPALKLMIDAVHRYDGYVVQSTGDGIFALFGAPVAHEDHPQRAVHTAIAARDDLRRRGDELRNARPRGGRGPHRDQYRRGRDALGADRRSHRVLTGRPRNQPGVRACRA